VNELDLNPAPVAAQAETEQGSDRPDAVQLWEAYFAGARYRLRVRVGNESTVLTLKGARALQRKLDAAIRRLTKKKAPR